MKHDNRQRAPQVFLKSKGRVTQLKRNRSGVFKNLPKEVVLYSVSKGDVFDNKEAFTEQLGRLSEKFGK